MCFWKLKNSAKSRRVALSFNTKYHTERCTENHYQQIPYTGEVSSLAAAKGLFQMVPNGRLPDK